MIQIRLEHPVSQGLPKDKAEKDPGILEVNFKHKIRTVRVTRCEIMGEGRFESSPLQILVTY